MTAGDIVAGLEAGHDGPEAEHASGPAPAAETPGSGAEAMDKASVGRSYDDLVPGSLAWIAANHGGVSAIDGDDAPPADASAGAEPRRDRGEDKAAAKKVRAEQRAQARAERAKAKQERAKLKQERARAKATERAERVRAKQETAERTAAERAAQEEARRQEAEQAAQEQNRQAVEKQQSAAADAAAEAERRAEDEAAQDKARRREESKAAALAALASPPGLRRQTPDPDPAATPEAEEADENPGDGENTGGDESPVDAGAVTQVVLEADDPRRAAAAAAVARRREQDAEPDSALADEEPTGSDAGDSTVVAAERPDPEPTDEPSDPVDDVPEPPAVASEKRSFDVRRVVAFIGVGVGAIGLAASVLLALAALLVAFGFSLDSGVLGAVSSICDPLTSPLRGLVSFSGANAEAKTSFVAYGAGSILYLLVGIIVPTVLRTRNDAG